MDQRMILGNGSSHDMTQNSLEGALDSRELQYLQGNIQHAPFKLPTANTDSAISSQASLSGYQNSIFETPPSIHNSPQFNSVLNTPIVTPLQGNLAVACCVCGSECGRGHGFQLSTCNHIYCNHCISLTIGQHGRFCTLCFATNMALESAYMRQMPTQRAQEDLTSLFSSRLQFNDALMGRPSALLENSFANQTPFSQRFDSLNKDSSSHFLFGSNSDSVRAPVFSPSNTLQKPRACIGCHEGASHYCENCQESLCGDCVVAHQRVRFTRDHHIVRLPMPDHSEYLKETVDQSRSLSSPKLEDSHIMHSFSTKMDHACPHHKGNPVVARCESCPSVMAQPLCVKCLPDHPRPQHHIFPIGDLKSTIVHFLREARHEERALTDAMPGLQHMSERVEASVGSTINDVRAEIHRHISALEERKRELLQKIETIHLSKQALLKAQSDRILSRKHKLTQVYKFVENLEDNETNLMRSFNQLVELFTACPPSLVPNEIDLIRYLAPEATLVESIRNLGDLESGPSALTSGILGESAQKIVLDRYTTILVQLRDACGANVSFSGYVQFVLVKLIQPDGTMLDLGISERSIGIVAINFVPKIEGIHHLHIQIHGMNIKGAPIQLEVRRGRNYQDISSRGELFNFGKEGSEDGELCRPWGICCDHKGRIIVADRSNNRIQIFDPEGKFLQKFGNGGNKPGQFDRPAGVCVNTHNQIIVADKDNHRVQVFDNDGNFVFKFGERGRPQGMFNYPWGVATNAHNEIAVSDTRNHRVQIFSSTGEFLLKCGFDTAYFYKHLDSPRGVCYLPNGQLLITDFNNHRVVLMGPKGGPDMKCYGSEGDQEGLFLRPQGIAIDMEGHILVCDSRNNRIQVFASDDMRCVSVFGGAKLALSPLMNHVNKSPTQDTSLRSMSSVTPMQGGQSSLDFTSPPPTNSLMAKAPVPPFSPNTTLNETPGSSAALLDRPTDLCIGLDGRIYVVDFGNNCIRVF